MKVIDKFAKILGIHHGESIEDLRKRGVKIGENVSIFSSEIDHGHGFLIEIGNDVTITHATLLSHDASTKRTLGYSKVGKIKIGNNVFIGYGSIILPGVTIGNDVIIGAGAVVRNNIPDNSVVIGNPAQIVCSMSNYCEKNAEKMKTVPVYETYWRDKSEDEKGRMITELDNSIGFDI